MKKLLSLLLISSMLIVSAGCSDEANPANAPAADELSSSAEEKKESKENKSDEDQDSEKEEETLENRTREIDTENAHVYDESVILNDGEFEALNSYTAWLAKTFKINAAIVLTEDIGDSEPSEYAKNFYESNYSGDGVLFLINNDTEEDYFYRQGIPAKFISDSDVQMLFSEISPMLVMEDYVAAAERVLEEVELLVPEHFTDRTGDLEPEKISEYNSYIKENGKGKNINVYYVYGIGEEGTEEFAKKRFDLYYDSGEDAAMLTIDTANGDSWLCVSGNMEYLADSRTDIQKAVKACYNKEKGMDAGKAVEKFIGFVE